MCVAEEDTAIGGGVFRGAAHAEEASLRALRSGARSGRTTASARGLAVLTTAKTRTNYRHLKN